MTSKIKTVAIVGGGFSGTLTAVHLIKNYNEPLNIILIDKAGDFARGVAYSTPDQNHLLNVVAEKMGAFYDNHNHFYEWLVENESVWKSEFAKVKLDPKTFVSRKLYGNYLEDIFSKALAEAKTKNISVSLIKANVTNLEIIEKTRRALITLDSQSIEADKVVLAVGNFPSKTFEFESPLFNTEKYIKTAWSHSKSNLINKDDLSQVHESENVVIIGTGLTMIDMIVSLHNKNYKGNIIAISRNGKIPQAHKSYNKIYSNNFTEKDLPNKALKLYQLVRNEVIKAEKQGYDWRAVIDSFRSLTVPAWIKLNVVEKRKLIKKLFLWWNIHRHRIPPESNELLLKLQNSRKLKIFSGYIYYVSGNGDNPLKIAFREKFSDEVKTIEAGYVINCSGPELDIAKSGNQLLLSLRDKESITVGPLRMGIEINKYGRVKGNASDVIHTLGPILCGEYLETTAVPELRYQTYNLAKEIIESLIESEVNSDLKYLGAI